MIFGIMVVAALIVAYDLPDIRKKGTRKELAFFTGLLAIACVLSAIYFLGLQLANPLDWIAFIYQPLFDHLLRDKAGFK
ncbi:hypothetical protein [Heliophilum fasciatum]|nr:hypothetical protein [Heliophilum fasciatum]